MSNRRRKVLALCLATGGLASVASAQNTISTIFGQNNNGSAGGIVFFDIVTGPRPITIRSLDVNTLATAGSTFGFTLYTVPGGSGGHEQTPGDWTLRTTGAGTAAGTDLPSQVLLNIPVELAANTTYGVGLVLNGGGGASASHAYTNGTGANQTFSNADLTLNLGSAQNVPFTGAPFTPRVWNGTVHYTLGAEFDSARTTLFQQNNSGNAGGIVFFNVTVGPVPITLTSLDVNTLAGAGSTFGCSFYTVQGGFAGHEQNAGDWTLRTNGSGISAGTNAPSPVALNTPVVLAANTTVGVGLVLDGGGGGPAAHAYTNGTGSNQSFSNPDLSMSLGAAQNVPFTGAPFSPRVWNGSLHYRRGAERTGTTLFQTNNNGTAGGIVFFDIATGSRPITISSLDVNTLAAAGSTFGFSFYTVQGGFAGHEQTAGDWTLQSNGLGVAAGQDLLSPVQLNSEVVLSANTTYGIGLVLDGGGGAAASHAYTNGTGSNQMYSTPDFTLNAGAAQNVPFTGAPFTPRVWNGRVHYRTSPICNSGFESGSFAPCWTQFGDTGFTAVHTGNFIIDPYGGTHSAHFGPTGGNGGIRQQLSGVPAGSPVRVSFWYAAQGTNNFFSADLGSTHLIDFTDDTSRPDWTQFIFTVLAPSANPTLAFTFFNPPSYDFLDGVSVITVAAPACYANCDGSTIPPVLNVNDFICFQAAFAAGQPYANCDGSTVPPVLNVNDFICFQAAFAAGCP